MAKKRKELRPHDVDADAEEDTSDAQEDRREDERGRTVLARVGKAIQSGTKLTVEWHPIYNTPRGDNRTTLSSYIGVVVRERVNVNYEKWGDVPGETVTEVYEFIAVSI